MVAKENLLVVFLKEPLPGNVKTRLAKEIGDEKAVIIYKKILDKLFKELQILPAYIETRLYLPKDTSQSYINELNKNGFVTAVQSEGGLGKKLSNVFDVNKQIFKKIVVIGSDIPDIDSELIISSFDVLNDFNYVIGPSPDGGYYLIGSDKATDDIFHNVRYSSTYTYEDTLKNIKNNKKNVKSLKILNDIDTLDDLKDFPYML